MQTEFMLLGLYGSPFLTFEEVCKTIGISKNYGYNLRHQKVFPIPLMDAPLRAAVQDVAEYIDQQRELAKGRMSK